MQFVYPQVLWALLLLAIPIIIHLFYFRRYRKVYFTNVRFLKSLKDEKSINQKLKNILILLSRLLALLFLILAFAQPFFGKKRAQETRHDIVAIYIDNSQSMTALSKESDLLNQGLDYAESIINSYELDTRFYILTNNFTTQERQSNLQDQAISRLNSIKPSYKLRSIDEVLNFMTQELGSKDQSSADLYVISDFQESFATGSHSLDSSFTLNLIPIQALEQKNLSIDSCWFESPRPLVGENQKLYIQLTNHSNEESQSTNLTLTLNTKEQPLGQITVPASETIVDTAFVNLNSESWYEAKVSINDFPIQFDDSYLMTFKPIEKIAVTDIYSHSLNRFLEASLENEQFFNSTFFPASNLDFSQMGVQDLIILDHLESINTGFGAELEKYVERGGNLCIFPNTRMNNQLKSFYANSLGIHFGALRSIENKVFQFDKTAELFDNLFFEQSGNMLLPTVNAYYPLSSNEYLNPLMTFRNESIFLGKKRVQQGNVYVYSTPLDVKLNDLPNFPQFLVPLIYKMGVNKSNHQQLSYQIGESANLNIAINSSEDDVLRLDNSESELIPYQESEQGFRRLFFGDLDLKPDIYQIKSRNGDLVSKVAFNRNSTESKLNYKAVSELEQDFPEADIYEVKSSTQLINTLKLGVNTNQYWKFCLILVVLFLIIEVILIKFWSKN